MAISLPHNKFLKLSPNGFKEKSYPIHNVDFGINTHYNLDIHPKQRGNLLCKS